MSTTPTHGDLAVITEYLSEWPAVFLANGRHGEGWYSLAAKDGVQPWTSRRDPQRRPLVVIDAEDPAEVERLLRGYYSRPGEYVLTRSVTSMQAALREFAAPTPPPPPKPAEPTGLGAVVVDDEGRTWVRAFVDSAPWFGTGDGCWRSWAGFNVSSPTQIKSEGAQS